MTLTVTGIYLVTVINHVNFRIFLLNLVRVFNYFFLYRFCILFIFFVKHFIVGNIYALRANLSIAIVAMVSHKERNGTMPYKVIIYIYIDMFLFYHDFIWQPFLCFILWESVLLVEETKVRRENHRPAVSHWQTLSHNFVSSTPCHEQDLNSQH